MDWKWVLLLPQILSLYITLGSEVVVQVNTKKWIYYVPERFLSLTVDPLTLAAASPLTQESYNMAKGLSPSFVRLGGIGTNALIFGKEFMVNSSTVSESQWDSVNDFARGTGLDIIASLNPSIQVQGVWDSQNSLELISYSNKKRYSVAWQLGYDVRGYNASGAEIGRDLVRLAKILDGFPSYAGFPVFSPDILSVSGAKQIHFVKDLLTNAGNSLGSIILQPKFVNDGEPEDPYELMTSMTSELDTYVWNKEVRAGRAMPKKPVWIAEPTASKGSFREAMKLVKRLGVAAMTGIQIYMRQAGAISLKSPTPDFWFSLLYKNLVGQGVLDNKIVSQNQSDLHVFAHCTAAVPQDKSVLDTDWNYEKGAVTLFGVNESPEPVKLVLKVTSKEEPLHIYVLTPDTKNEPGKNPTTLLNGQELMLSPTWDLPVLSPKVKRPSKSASVMLPGGSIFFIVMPDSKIRTCSVPPLATPDFNLSELTKRLRLGSPKKTETLDEEEIDPAEDLKNEGVYVSFVKKKRHDVEANNNNARSDIIGKSLMQTIISKLSPKKSEATTTNKPGNEEDMPVYITFNENSFLNKLAEGVKEELKEEDQQELDTRRDKYALLTAAVTNTKPEMSSAKSAEMSAEPDVIKIEPVIENSKVPDVEPDQDKSVSRMRRSSNEDAPPGSTILTDEKPMEIIKKITECKKTGAAMVGEVGDIARSLDHVVVSVGDSEVDPEQIEDKTRSARHIVDGTVEESDHRNMQSCSDDGVKKVAVGALVGEKDKDDDDEDVAKKTSALVKVVQETEKVENVSESPGGVVVPPAVSEKKLDEIMLEAAKSKSEPEPDSDSPLKEGMSSVSETNASNEESPKLSSETSVKPSTMVMPGVTEETTDSPPSTGYPQVPTLVQSQPVALNISILPYSSGVSVVTNGDIPGSQVSPGSQIVSSSPMIVIPQPSQQQMIPIQSVTKDNHILKIPPSTPHKNADASVTISGENNAPIVMTPMSSSNQHASFYNEQKENAINNILTKIVNQEDTKLAKFPPHVVDGGSDSQLMAVPLPGNDAILMASDDVKSISKDEGTSDGVKTLENNNPLIELANGEDTPSVKVSRQVDVKAPVMIAVTPVSQTATLSAPVELTVASTPAGPVSPFKSSENSNNPLQANQVRETLKAPSPEELRERFKSLREKMLELRSQYVAAREKRLEEIKKQVASRGPPPGSEADETIKSTIKRREAELKEWFKKFDKRETQPSAVVVPLEDKTNVKSRPRRLSLFTNNEGFDMASFFDEEPSESYNYKRSPEISSQNRHQNLPMVPDTPPTLPKTDAVGKHIFPLDTKTHGIVYNNKIYPAKLFGYIDKPHLEKSQLKKDEPVKDYMPTMDANVEDSKFEGRMTDVKTSMEIPKSRERIAFVPRDAFMREMKSDFIPVIIIPPDDSEDIETDDSPPARAKRSTLDTLEDQFHQLKEELLPKISSWLKKLSDNPPWKRDLERSTRNRRSIEDILRTNDLRSLSNPKIPSRKYKDMKTQEIEDLIVNNVDKGEDEIYATAKKYVGLVEKIGDQVLTEETVEQQSNTKRGKSDMGYCEEIGTSKESIIRDPFDKSDLNTINMSKSKLETEMEGRSNNSPLDTSDLKMKPKSDGSVKSSVSSLDAIGESMFASVIAQKIKLVLDAVTDFMGVSM